MHTPHTHTIHTHAYTHPQTHHKTYTYYTSCTHHTICTHTCTPLTHTRIHTPQTHSHASHSHTHLPTRCAPCPIVNCLAASCLWTFHPLFPLAGFSPPSPPPSCGKNICILTSLFSLSSLKSSLVAPLGSFSTCSITQGSIALLY